MKGNFIVSGNENAERLDIVFNGRYPDFSRSYIKNLIGDKKILLQNKVVKAGEKVKEGQIISFDFDEIKPLDAKAQNIEFEIIYQDDDLLVINKPQGLVVHPCSSTKDGTLVNGLLYKVKDLSGINGVLRPGIVHRLDKNTSGLMLVAKNDKAHVNLAEQIKNKTCRRKYIALCEGVFKQDEGQIQTYLERSNSDRKKYMVSSKGKLAITNFKVLKRFSNKTLVEFELKTGRTHQIRVHCKYLNHAIVGDDLYGKPEKCLKGQLLHSFQIEFVHPTTGEKMQFSINLPKYFEDFINKLK